MADLISVISLVEGSIGLVLQCGSVAKTLSDMKAKFKHAEIAIMSLIQEVETIQFAWSRVKEWSEDHAEAATDSQFVLRLEKSLECGTLVLSALEQDLADYKHRTANANFVLRSKMAWNERAFLDHQHRVRGQVHAMNLLLQVSQLSTSKEQTELLKKKEKAFRASDESAFSIVPSRMSSHMSVSTRPRDSVSTMESQELVYYPLSFDDDLFTARVYKRNYRNPWIRSLIRLHWGKKSEGRRVPSADPETFEDGHSFLSSSTGTATPTIMSANVSQPLSSNQEIFLRDLRPLSPRPALTEGTRADPIDLERPVKFSGSVPSPFEERQRFSSGLRDRAMDSSVKPMYPAEGKSDTSNVFNPTTGYFPHMNEESNVAVGPPPLSPKARDKINRSLLLAVYEGNLDDIKTIIDCGAQVNPYKRPPLYLAVCRRDVTMTELLLQEGADYALGWCGTPPIHRACKNGDIKITELLLDAGASANSLDAQQEQPLHAMLSTESPMSEFSGLIGLLICRGADLNARSCTEKTPLHLSCEHDNVDNVRALLVHGTNTDARDRIGNTPFHSLVTNWTGMRDPAKFEAITQLLLQHGFNVNAQNNCGDTPFHILCKWGLEWQAAIPHSLKHGDNVNAQNSHGQMPLLYSVTGGPTNWPDWTVYLAVFQSLVKYGAQVNIQNEAGDTPLHILARCGHHLKKHAEGRMQLIHGLFDAGTDLSVNMQNENGNTPLHLLFSVAVWPDWRVREAFFESLIRHGAQLSLQNNAGDTPLHIIIRSGQGREGNAESKSRLIRGLFDAGADLSVNIQNARGDTPLHILARRTLVVEKDDEWKDQLIYRLLHAGADLSISNVNGESAWNLLDKLENSSLIHQAALARAPQEFISEGDEEEIGVASLAIFTLCKPHSMDSRD